MTNLYDFLRSLQAQGHSRIPGAAPLGNGDKLFLTISPEELTWLDSFLKSPENEIHFKSRQTGHDTERDEPIMAFDFMIAGNPFEVFCMLTEAMVSNYLFASSVLKAAGFYTEHIPTCPECSKKHFGAKKPDENWIFSPHNKLP